MKRPNDYPFIAPCPGCFENFLLSLSESEHNEIFFGNGDFTVVRLMTGLSKILVGCHLTISLYLLDKSTVNALATMIYSGHITGADVYFRKAGNVESDLDRLPDSLRLIPCDTLVFLAQASRNERMITVTGFLSQDFPSRSLELYTMINDKEQQKIINKTLKKILK